MIFAHERSEEILEVLIQVQNFNTVSCVLLKRSEGEEFVEKSQEDLKLATSSRKEFNAAYKKKLKNEGKSVKEDLK